MFSVQHFAEVVKLVPQDRLSDLRNTMASMPPLQLPMICPKCHEQSGHLNAATVVSIVKAGHLEILEGDLCDKCSNVNAN